MVAGMDQIFKVMFYKHKFIKNISVKTVRDSIAF